MGGGLPIGQGDRNHIIANSGLQQAIREAIGLGPGWSHHQQIGVGVAIPVAAGPGAKEEHLAGGNSQPIAISQRLGDSLAPLGQPALLPRLAQPLQGGKLRCHR